MKSFFVVAIIAVVFISTSNAIECGPGGSCPTGMCCSISNHCGTGPEYCDPHYLRCGQNFNNKGCPQTDQCCSSKGWFGTTYEHCTGENTPSPTTTTTTTTYRIRITLRSEGLSQSDIDNLVALLQSLQLTSSQYESLSSAIESHNVNQIRTNLNHAVYP